MSDEKNRLHFISAVIEPLKALKGMLIPLVIILVANGFNINFDITSPTFFKDSITLLIFLIIIIGVFIHGFLRWWTFTYWVEQNEFRVEYGLFIKKKSYIPFERIQNLNEKEGILHRIFRLVQVSVETAGGNEGKPEVTLTAISKVEAEKIKQAIENKTFATDVEGKEKVEESRPMYKVTTGQLLLIATTSNSTGVVFIGILAVLTQFIEYLPLEKIFNSMTQYVEMGIIVLLLLFVLVLFVVWLISVTMTFLGYYNFTISKDNEKIIITRGLLEKKRIMIPLNRIQAIKISENPLRQLFGFCTVFLESAGGDFSGSAERKIILIPILRKKEVIVLLKEILPQYVFEAEEFTFSPKKASPFFYRLNFIWVIPLVGLSIYFFYPYGMISIIIAPLLALFGFWQHKSAAFALQEKQLLIQYRVISKITFIVLKNKIQAMEKRQTIFQKNKSVATVKVTVMSSSEGAVAKAYHMDDRAAQQLMTWYKK